MEKKHCERVLPGARVTRLGEFSPHGRLFTLGSGLKITEVVHICVLLLSMVPITYVHINFEKNDCAIFWAIFFTDSFGHSAGSQYSDQFLRRWSCKSVQQNCLPTDWVHTYVHI
jgi:hypothetical protein